MSDFEEEDDDKLSPAAMRALASVIRHQSNVKGMSKAAIGRFWDMPRETVRDIVLGKTWKPLVLPELVQDPDDDSGDPEQQAQGNRVADPGATEPEGSHTEADGPKDQEQQYQ